MILPDAHLVIEESIGLALGDLHHRRGLLVEDQHLGLLEMLQGPSLGCGTLPHGKGSTGLIEIPWLHSTIRQAALFTRQNGQSDREIRI